MAYSNNNQISLLWKGNNHIISGRTDVNNNQNYANRKVQRTILEKKILAIRIIVLKIIIISNTST